MNVPPVASAPWVSSGVPSATASAGRWGWGAFAPTVTNRFSPPSCSARRGCYNRLTSPRPSVLFAIRPLHYSRSPTPRALNYAGRDAWGDWFRGNLDEVAIYNRPLTATQVQAHFQAGRGSNVTGTMSPTATAATPTATNILTSTTQ